MDDDYTSARCAMPGCDANLHLIWTMSVPVYLADLRPSAEPPEPVSAYTQTWRVECEEGHVLLLPGDCRCPCGNDECNGCQGYDFDGSEDTRTFRRQDTERLSVLLDTLSPVGFPS